MAPIRQSDHSGPELRGLRDRLAVAVQTSRVQSSYGYMTCTIPEESKAPLVDALEYVLRDYVGSEKQVGVGFTHVFGGILEPSLEHVAEQFVVAAHLHGVDFVLNFVSGGLCGTPLSYERHTTLVGATIDQTVTLHDGLIRIFKAPMSSGEVPATLSRQPYVRMMDVMGAPVLSVACSVGPAFYSAGASYEDQLRFDWAPPIPPSFGLESFCEALSLAGNGCVQVEYMWPHAPDLEPFWGTHPGVSYKFRARKPRTAVSITQRLLEEAWSLWQDCHDGDGIPKALRLAISRWIQSKQRWSVEDGLIELRVALEALYLADGSSGELSYRIATRAAWHLGDSVESRKDYYQTLRKVYNSASKVLHGQRLKTSQGTDLLGHGQDACRKGILKMLKNGQPDWTALIFGDDPVSR